MKKEVRTKRKTHELKVEGFTKTANVLTFKKLIIENMYVFSGVNTIPLDNTGLVKVTGINQDTKTPSSNGAGKTRAWHCLLRLLYGRKAMKKEKPSDAYDTEVGNARVEVHFEKGGHVYVFREVKKHNDFGDGLYLFKDGKPHGVKNDPEALRKEVQAIINRSYEEFVGTIIWRQNADHVLIDGTPAERSQWISTFFGLGVYDELFKSYAQKLDNTKEKIANLADTRARSKVLQDSLDGAGDVEEARHKVKRIKSKLEELVSLSDKNTSTVEKLRDKEGDLKHLSELKTQIDEAGASGKKSSDLAKLITTTKTNIDELKTKINLVEDAAEITNQYTESKKKAEEAKSKLVLLYQEVFRGDDKIPTVSDLKPYQIEAAERAAVLRATMERAKKQTVANAESVKALRRLDDMGYANCDMKYLKEMRTVHQDEILANEKIISKNEATLERETLINDHIVRCPTCGTKVDAKSIQEAIEIAKGRINEAKVCIKTNKKELDEFEYAITLREVADKKIAGEDIDVKVIDAKIVKLELKTLALGKMIEFATRYEKHTKILKSLKEQYLASKDLKEFNTEAARKQIIKHEEELERLTVLKAAIEQYERITEEYRLEDAVDIELAKTKRKRMGLEDQNIEISERITKLRIKLDRSRQMLENHKELVNELEKLKEGLAALRRLERKERIYKSLKKAYDKNGLKVRRLRELMQAIKTRLPVWTNILFTEKNFTIDVTGNEKKIGFEITQKKNVLGKDGKTKIKTKTYDAAEASGSERTRISCALMLTMADVASSEKQCNLLVLDELERGLDAQSRDIMADEIIPLLKNKKPSLFLITHSLDVDPTNWDAELMIVKKNQQSTIKFHSKKTINKTAKKENK